MQYMRKIKAIEADLDRAKDNVADALIELHMRRQAVDIYRRELSRAKKARK